MTEYLIIYERGEDGSVGRVLSGRPRLRRGRWLTGGSRAADSVRRCPHHVASMREVGEPLAEPHHLVGVIAA